MRLSELTIITTDVYLNVISGDIVETMSLPTDEAVRDYGTLEVSEVSEPVIYDDDSNPAPDPHPPGRRRKKKSEKITKKRGVTNVILISATIPETTKS